MWDSRTTHQLRKFECLCPSPPQAKEKVSEENGSKSTTRSHVEDHVHKLMTVVLLSRHTLIKDWSIWFEMRSYWNRTKSCDARRLLTFCNPQKDNLVKIPEAQQIKQHIVRCFSEGDTSFPVKGHSCECLNSNVMAHDMKTISSLYCISAYI